MSRHLAFPRDRVECFSAQQLEHHLHLYPARLGWVAVVLGILSALLGLRMAYRA